MMGPMIIHTRKEYGLYFNLASKLIQHKSSLNKIIALVSDLEKDVVEYNTNAMRYAYEGQYIRKSIEIITSTKSEVGKLTKDIFAKQIEDIAEKGLADSLTNEEFPATMIILE